MREYYKVNKRGSLARLKKSSEAIPDLTDGKVLVSVKAIGLNYADIFAIMGLYSAAPKAGFIPGLEYSGVVAASRSAQFQVGQRVFGLTKFGAYSSMVMADPNYLFPIPTGWSYEEASAYPVQTLTAYYALRTLGDLHNGQTVLIHSAAGGVGLQANRIAKKFDAYTVGVVGNERKLAVLKKEGYDKMIVRGRQFRRDLKLALDGRELHLVLETTGGNYFRISYDALAPMGRVVAFGSAEFTPAGQRPDYIALAWKYLFRPKVDPLSMITANKSVMAFNLIWLYEQKDLLKKLMYEITELELPPPHVGHTLHFDELPEALRLFKSGKTVGKVVILV